MKTNFSVKFKSSFAPEENNFYYDVRIFTLVVLSLKEDLWRSRCFFVVVVFTKISNSSSHF